MFFFTWALDLMCFYAYVHISNRNDVVRIHKTVAQLCFGVRNKRSLFADFADILFGGFNILALFGRRVEVFVR